ncbi:acyl-CoA synthetase (AMP-forming)/AMP-acid ligase II [Sphingomonas jinjuensis]|uniref:Acyl-CoA synthetase (AMP-forming)/AMP-acid ligase II n=1 Tax=Sphingomonas jinjuensis TaxID=535907 RepID=A0A840FGZ3_9SPHN|nr:class I adenylate-forming enzyme family protein [Sphingomonas jinjuensis]MBB4152605.1 acyl-CoA synthetase (AMP-forming)/AMP-acid ligase II [Sphingomonas jinjuensis]
MRTELDRRMDETMAALTGENGPLRVATVERDGRTMPIIATAPPTLAAYFAHFCAQHADATFLVAGDERLTFTQVYDHAGRVARALVGHGIARGDRVGIAMRNSPSWIVLYMGIIMAGGIATLLNGWWQAEELEAGIAEVDCTLVLADPPRRRRLDQLAGLSVRIIEIDDTLPLAHALAAFADTDATLPAIEPTDMATILFTSGSTGQSKGALADHRGIVQGIFNYLAQAMMMLGLATQDGNPPTGQPSTLLTIPLFHVTAEIPVMLQSFAMGRKLVIMPKWDALEAMRLIEREKITYFVGVPLMSFEILNHPQRDAFDLSTVTDFAAGGAPRPVEHVRRLDAEMGGPAPLIGYGLTETNAVGTGNWRSNYIAKPSSAGRPSAPLVDLAILDDDGRPLGQDERGEVSIRSVCNFRGYWRRPDATAACMTADGYFRTGDIGYLDEDGYLFIVDRKKDIIIRGGENISCQEVEAALYEHPDVAECAVFGLADERFGEVPGAVVHLAEGSTATVDDLCGFLKDHIAAFKVPQRLWLSAVALPRLGTEKIDKVSLRNTYRALAAKELA